MRINLFIFSFLLLFTLKVNGQIVDSLLRPSVVYWNTFAFGALSSDSDKPMTASLTTTHGIAFGKWKVGVGLGVEGYEGWRTYRFFGSVSFDFGKVKNNAFYLQLNAGKSLGRKLEEVEGVFNEDEQGGLMFNSMLGYRISTNKVSVCIAAGYKLQRLEYEFDGYWGWQYGHHSISQEFNRFMLQLGIGIR
jgi:hypothetical protein